MMMMRLVLSFAILHVIVVIRIRTIVPKRRDESPHTLSQRLLSLSCLFQKPAESTNAKKKKTKKERKHKFCEDKGFYICREKTKQQRDIKKLDEKGAHINSA